jgi:hypothetical protein
MVRINNSMSNIKITDLLTTDNVTGSEYIIVDNSISTRKTTLNTLARSLCSDILPNNIVSSISAAALEQLIIDLGDSVPGAFDSLISSVSGLSADNWNSAYTTVKSTSGDWGNNTLYNDYGITYNNTQIRGEVNLKQLIIYTALTVKDLPTLAIGNIIQETTSSKQGTLKYIDSDNKLLYIKDDNFTTSFATGNYTSNYPNSFVVTHVNTFTTTLQPNHTLKIFNATDNSLSAATLPTEPVNVLSIAGGAVTTTLYDYRVVQFKYADGKFSDPSSSTVTTSCNNIAPSLLGNSSYNRLLLSRTSDDYGMAIYRKTDELGYILISILGERELGTGTSNLPYLDRGGLNSNIWATDIKSNITGVYTTDSVYYIPTNINSFSSDKYKKGFVTARLTAFTGNQQATLSKSLTGSSVPVDIFIDSSAMYNNAGTLVGGLNKAITDNANGITSQIFIPNGNYFTSTLRLSSNIQINGESKTNCNIKLLPWQFSSNGVINASNISNFNIYNLTIDGNYVNNTGRSNFENNFAVNNRDSSKFVYDNIGVANSTGGGLYALRSSNFKIINSEIKNGAIELTSDKRFTGLYAQQADTFILNSNNFENWLGPIDFAVTRVGSAANNVIKNCGVGVVVYGATALQISPNLILGQDNEMLPIADLFDAKFDAINIELEEGEDYTSDIILYMRDGQGAWLSNSPILSSPGTNVILTTDIRTLVKTGNYSYTLPYSSFNYSTYSTNVPTISIISSENELKLGRVQFKLNTAAIASLSTYGQLIQSYNTLTGRPNGETLVGLVYKIKATEYLFLDRLTDDLIRVGSYEFNTNGSIRLYLDTKENISLFSINDIVYGVGIRNGNTAIDERDLTVTNIVIERTGSNISTAYLICSGSYTISDTAGALIDCINSEQTPSYIGIKNSFTISKGTINKI